MRKWIGNEPPNKVTPLTSNKNGVESVIVDMMGYDEFGHMVYQKLGNGAETTYAYDRQRQRLQEMNLSTAGSQLMQNRYEYDKVDNILSLVNSINPQTLTDKNSAKLGGTSTHRYQYDELNRLINASGTAKNASYSMTMTFNNMSMPLTKTQNVDSTTTALSYNNHYSYEDDHHPTAPTQIGNDRYEYDANGNPTLVTNDSLNTTRELYWDEENRLMVLSDNGKTSRYTYNHAGERIVKSHGDLEGVYINGAPQGITFHEHDDFTIYPASIISVNKNRFTKHYFIGSQRIASKLGSGRFNNVYGRNGSYITAGQQDYAERLNQIESQREEYYKELGIPPGVPTMKGAYGDPENTGVGYNTIITELGDHSMPKNWEQFVVKREPGETPGPPIIWSDPQDPEDAHPGYGFIAETSEPETEETFFYHSDHLGSTSYITDDKGNVTQYTAYLPYGELLVDEHSSSEDLPYKFNGKELDEETGLYYYGARYMLPMASIWYGVDPLFEKYPQLSAYNYCAGNPINAVDPDGKYILFINGLRLWHGARDQKTFFNNSFGGKTSIYSDDEFKYWSSKNHNGNEVNIVDYYMEQYQDYNVGFASGSSFWNSQASDRKADGRVKAQQFHDLVQSGDIAIREGETIKIIAHSQGAAHATGFAEQLMEYKTAEGQNMYNIEIIEYIAPHQPKDIQHPKGIKGIQFSHPDDKVASKNWIINGGTEFGRIKDVPVFISGKGNHSVLDNREFIKNGEKYR